MRQTLLATNLAQGALVAWQVPEVKLEPAFDYMFQRDPFSGHVVIRTTDTATVGSKYRLWTTLKVPQGFSMTRHCEFLCRQTGAEKFILLPAKKLFALGVGHVRRRGLEPGSRAQVLADVTDVSMAELDDSEWRVLVALKREFTPEELMLDIWAARAKEAGVPLEQFLEVAAELNRRKIIGRFSTFLEHVKPVASGEQVTRYNALFHWAVPPGREIDAGREVGRHHIMTHAYWREGEHRSFITLTSWASRTGPTNQCSSPTKPQSTRICRRRGLPSPTPTSFGAVGARSSRARFRRLPTGSGLIVLASILRRRRNEDCFS